MVSILALTGSMWICNIYSVTYNNIYLYIHTELIKEGIMLEPAVTYIVIGHWSQEGDLKPAMVNGNFNNWFTTKDTHSGLEKIETFSHYGQTVLVTLDSPEPGKNFSSTKEIP